MAFRRIDYLEWARTQMGKVRYDLARSNVKALSKEDLGLTLDQVALSAPDEGHPGLRELLAKRYATSPSNLLVTSGATQAIYLAFAALLESGDRVLLETPRYEPLARAAEERGAELRPLERRFERGFQVELEELERAVDRGTRAIVLTNLHNPSGAATSAEKLQQIGQLARENGAAVLSCEAYLDGAFSPGLRPAATLGPNLVSIGSLSKVYGLGGLRIGWMVAEEGLIRKARAALDYLVCDLPAPSESIALAALKRADEWAERCRGIARRNVAAVREWVAKRDDVAWSEPAGGTVCLVKLPAGLDATSLSAHLREKHSTLAVPGDFFGLPGFLRISTGMDEDVLRQGLKNVGKGIDQLKAQRG